MPRLIQKMKTNPTRIHITSLSDNHLPFDARHDTVAIERLDVGNSGIEKCTLTIGDSVIQMSIGRAKHPELLFVNGIIDLMPAYSVSTTELTPISLSFPHQQASSQNLYPLNIVLWVYLYPSTLPPEV